MERFRLKHGVSLSDWDEVNDAFCSPPSFTYDGIECFATGGLKSTQVAAISRAVITAMAKPMEEAVQLHGGIGMTAEYAVGHYFKRMTVIDQLYGDADTHLRQLARLGGLFGRAA